MASVASQSAECLSCHMTLKGKSRNVLASPLGEEGHEVAKGCPRVRSKNDIGRRLAARTAMEHPIGALPCTPFCLFEAFPLKGKREIWREKQGVIYFMYHSAVSPFGGERSEPVSRMVILPYDTEGQFRNADFISIAAERQSTTLGPKARQT